MRTKEIKVKIDESVLFKIECALPEKVTIDDVVASLLLDHVYWLSKDSVIERVKGRAVDCLERR